MTNTQQNVVKTHDIFWNRKDRGKKKVSAAAVVVGGEEKRRKRKEKIKSYSMYLSARIFSHNGIGNTATAPQRKKRKKKEKRKGKRSLSVDKN